MKKIRKWLVKNFVLGYVIVIRNQMYDAPRASRIIFPAFILMGITGITNPNWPVPNIPSIIAYIIVLLSLYFGFIHFHIPKFKVEWEELDVFQKFQYGQFKYDELTPVQRKEYKNIADEVMEFYNNYKPSMIESLISVIIDPFMSIPTIFKWKNFIEENYYKHFFYTILIVFIPLFLLLQFTNFYHHTPEFLYPFIGYMVGYTVNHLKEGRDLIKFKSPWDWNDVYAGAFGGCVAGLLNNLIF